MSAEESPERFFAENPPPCIIDEIQYAPLFFRHLKVEIDKNRHAMGSWILTGSQKFTLMKNGALWETYVFAEMRKAIETSGKNRTLYYYRDNGGVEVDFIVTGDGCRLIEAKWTELPRFADTTGIRKLAAIGQKANAAELWGARGYVVCRTRNDYPMVDSAALPMEAISMESLERMLDL